MMKLLDLSIFSPQTSNVLAPSSPLRLKPLTTTLELATYVPRLHWRYAVI